MDEILRDHRGEYCAVFEEASHSAAKPPNSVDERAPDPIVKLYHSHAVQLAASVRKTYGDGPPDPEDVTQQAFQQLMERGDLETIDNLKAFLWRTARNIVLGVKRSQNVRSRYDFEVEQLYFPLKGDESTPERIIVAREQLRAINEVLRRMPSKRRRAVILHRVEGLSVAEVGRVLGISRQNAAKHLAKGVADLNVVLLNDLDDTAQ